MKRPRGIVLLYGGGLFALAYFLFSFYILQDFTLPIDAFLLIAAGCLIEYFFVKEEDVGVFSAGVATVILSIFFFDIQVLLLSVTFAAVFSLLSKNKRRRAAIREYFTLNSFYDWGQGIVIGVTVYRLREWFQVDLSLSWSYLEVFLSISMYIFLSCFVKGVYLRLQNLDVFVIARNRLGFMLYAATASLMMVYIYYDRGIFLTLVAHVFIVYLHKSSSLYHLYKKKEDLSNRDSLTGAYNMRYMREVMDGRGNSFGGFAVAMVDIDDFKRVNDIHGHLAGDAALKSVFGKIREAVRVDDVVARFGGDEFCILLRDKESAPMVAARLREGLANLEVSFEGVSFYVSSSVGFYICEDPVDTLDSVIGRADKSLYCEKEKVKE